MKKYLKLISISNPVRESKASLPLVEKEVVFSEGMAGATSSDGSAATRAFDPDNRAWVTSLYSKTQGTQHLWYDFKNPGRLHCPIKISFLPRQDGQLTTALDQLPRKFQFTGSNDESCNEASNWDVLCERESEFQERPSSQAESRGCEVKRPCKKYRCIGIKVMKVYQGLWVALDKVRMWVAE